MSTRDNKAIGRKAKAIGAAFETWIDGQHQAAHALGILAFVEKTEAHSQVIHGRVEFIAPGVADYIGTLCDGGKTLAVEAKSTDDAQLMRSVVSPKQAKHLDAVAAAGGLALLLVEFRHVSQVGESYAAQVLPIYARYAVPWLEVPWQTLRTAESVAEASIQQWRILADTCYLSKYHSGGVPVGSVGRKRVFPRE